MAASTSSIIDLFAMLASHLQSPVDQEEEEEELDLSISKLNQSLNLAENPDSGVRVLDAALSLMCFTAPQVFDRQIEYLVKTIVTVLSASINCKVCLVQNVELLQIGSSISSRDCLELLQMYSNLCTKLVGHGVLSPLLLRAVVRLAVSTSCYQHIFPCISVVHVKSREDRSKTISKLHCHLSGDLSPGNQEIPLRLLFWYLDPLTLREAVSGILQDTMERPFLCLSEEFYHKEDWRAIIICLGLSPMMFIEIRTLLHNWFLMTGLSSILELLVGVVSAILDLISRPTWWGITVELGSKLPFSTAYFPYENYLLRILAGPLTCENFLYLVHATCKQVCHGWKQFHPLTPSAMDVARIDHKSLWALAIDFPDWFYFASFLLFSGNTFQENFQSKCTLKVPKVGQTDDEESLCAAAAGYIAWIVSPICKSNQDLLVDCLTKIVESWTLKQFGSGMRTAICKKKLKKPKIHDNREDYALEKEYDWQKIRICLKDTQNMCLQYGNKAFNDSASRQTNASQGLNLQHDMLLRRVLLGILIGCPHVTEDGCGLLLHYAATGKIVELSETSGAGPKHVKWNSERQHLETWTDKCSKKEVMAGVCLVFNLTDIVESISASYFHTEENGLDFIYQVKVKGGKYLIKCIRRLIKLLDEGEVSMLRDLHGRLVRWKHQGQVVSQFQNEIDDAINDLNDRLSS